MYWSVRADVEERLGHLQDALASLNAAALLQETSRILARRSTLKTSLGDFEGARADLERAMALDPEEGELYRLWSTLHRFVPDDPIFAQMQDLAQRLPADAPAQVGFDFALAKALDDLGDYQSAFEHLMRANRAVRKAFPFDIRGREQEVRSYQRSFATFKARAYQLKQPSSYAPIFITGMPRSGTTLAEQIISSHAHVSAGGEVARFYRRMVETVGDPARGALQMTPERVAALAHRYEGDMLTRMHMGKRRTGKSLQTIMYAGTVLAALPHAKIIVVTRDPNATALSLLKQKFRPGKQLFSYALSDIRRYQTTFNEMVSYWSAKLPQAIKVGAYEDIVSDPEAVTREMLAFADLAWDDACLSPEKNERAVKTLSSVAVRAPISQGPRDHWKNYAPYLGTP